MDDAKFKTNYPHITFTDVKSFHLDDDTIKRATHNFECLFEELPEEQRIILNQLGLQVKWGKGHQHNGLEWRVHSTVEKFLHRNTPMPVSIRLDAVSFSDFDYEKHDIKNDQKRHAQAILRETAAHVVFHRIDHSPEWIKRVAMDWNMRNDNHSFNRLLMSFRYFIATPEGGKAPLQQYYEEAAARNPKMPNYPYHVLAYEWPAEIMHCRDFLWAANQYGWKEMFANPAQHSLNHYNESVRERGDAKTEDLIHARLSRQFPNTYHIFLEYEDRLKKQAAEIKKDPDAFPVPTEMGMWSQLKSRPNKWNDAFAGFLGGPAR
jgi:hypothetical protein